MQENKYTKGFYIKSIILVILLTATITMLITMLVTSNSPTGKIARKLSTIKQIMDTDYYGEIDENKIGEYAIKGYVEGLDDEYSQYFTKEEMAEYKSDNIEGKYVGVGIYIVQDIEKNAIRVLSPIKGSPAESAGILPGDYIQKIDGEEFTGDQIDAASNKMKGEEGTTVKIQILRGNETKEFEVERKNVRMNPIETNIYENNIGYIKISSFDEDCSTEFKKKYDELKNQNIQSLILDLRDNGGGIVNEALAIADMFTNKGDKLLITKDKSGEEIITYAKTEKEIDLPVIILINENTASASEILAGALKDNGVAKTVGTTTYGKGLIQELLKLEDESGLKLTTSEYYTPNKNTINKVGIVPDVEIELEDKYKNLISIPKDKDTQLNKAIELLKK